MLLRPIFPSTVLGHATTLLSRCRHCGGHVRSDTGFVDLDDEPFKAYYCDRCAAEISRAPQQTPPTT